MRGDDDARGHVRDADGGLDLVDVLPALAAGAEGVGLQIDRVDDDVARLLNLGDDVHAGEARVPAAVRVEGRDAHEPMDAALGLGEAVNVLALDGHGRALHTGDFALENVGDFHLPAAQLGPALIHPLEHIRPVLGLGAARTGVDAEDAAVLIVRAFEEKAQFQRVEFLDELIDVARELAEDERLRFEGFGLAQFDHHAGVFELLLGGEKWVELLAEAIRLINCLLRLLAVVPKRLLRHHGVQLR